ncbi:hypothetical protein WMY93_031578 [Mugilogobius chulae]|uniref:Tower domain-containing protein n=1 Tax=Mugilogobius chulae TaxID=88201 RepID=A0AAW0MDB8_9GOBI
MRIRKKKRQTIRALPGRVFRTKSSQVKRLSFRDAVNGQAPQKYSQKELYQFGVDLQVSHVTSQTAVSFCFNLLNIYKHQSFLKAGGVQLADGGWLVPTRDGTVGKEEFYKALCDTPGVDPKLISPQWVYNHYKWIVWKLASMESAFAESMANVCFTPEQVLLQLKFRYDVEVDHCRRSSLKKIMEKDDTPAKTVVLCVCGIQPSSGPESPCAIVWLTDGWYCIKGQLDAPLTAMLHRGHIAEGVKLMIHGAQVVGCEEACTPLEPPESLHLKICANSTRRVRWDTKLGLYKDPRPFVLPLCSLFSKGGAVGSVDMVILRIYPTQWMERKPNGGVVFRLSRAEEKEARHYNSHKQKHLEAMYAKIRAQFDKEDKERTKSKSRRQSVSHEELGRFQDGEELYEAVGDELSDVEAYLSAEQLQALCSYKRSLLEQRQAELEGRLRRAVEEAEASEGVCPRRDVVPVWRLCIMDYLYQTNSNVYQLSIWNPSAELQALLKEGCRYRTYNLTASEGRSGGGRPTVQLSATRKTMFTGLQASSHWLSAHFQPRVSVSFAELHNSDFMPLCGEVDITGCVISITDEHGSSPFLYLVDEDLNVVKVRATVSLAQCGWENLVQPHALLALSNLQVRGQCVCDPVVPVLYTGDMTELSTNPRESHLQQSLGRLRQALQDQDSFFVRAEQRLTEVLTYEEQSFSAVDPRTPQSKKSSGQELRTPQPKGSTAQELTTPHTTEQELRTPQSAKNPDQDHTKITSWFMKLQSPGLQIYKLWCSSQANHLPLFSRPLPAQTGPQRRIHGVSREALEHLDQYTVPPPLSPLNSPASSSVNKTFCPPRRSHAPCLTVPAPAPAPAPVQLEQGWRVLLNHASALRDENVRQCSTAVLLSQNGKWRRAVFLRPCTDARSREGFFPSAQK